MSVVFALVKFLFISSAKLFGVHATGANLGLML